MNRKIIFTLLMASAWLLFWFSAVEAGNRFQVSFQSGPLAPSDNTIHGALTVINDPFIGNNTAIAYGFGTGVEFIISGRYDMADWGVVFDGGIRFHTNREIKINGSLGRRHIDNNLTVVPIAVSVIRNIAIENTRFKPYIGFGVGVYFTTWETKDFYEGILAQREWYKDTNISPGPHFLLGLDFSLFREFVIKGEYRYSYIYSDWVLENQETDDVIKMYDVNLGGTSLRFGIGYNF